MSRRIYTILKRMLQKPLIPSGADLNDYLTPGKYRLNALSNYTNIPSGYDTYSAYMDVFRQYNPLSSNYTEQRLTLGSTYMTFTRRWSGTAWSTWVTYAGSRDQIVAQGTSGVWTYRKWASGIGECWTTKQLSFTGSSAAGSLMGGYYAQLNNPSWGEFPFSFVEPPNPSAMGRLGSGGGYTNVLVSTTNVTVISCVGNQTTNAMNNVSIKIIGNWK